MRDKSTCLWAKGRHPLCTIICSSNLERLYSIFLPEVAVLIGLCTHLIWEADEECMLTNLNTWHTMATFK